MEVIKCNPIDTLEELNSWKPPTSTAVLQHAHEDVRIGAQQPGHSFKRLRKSDAPKTLICHDMKGGYLDDCFVEGSDNCEAYSFTQWYLIDIFVYFSHHFITIPPPCWVHSGHIHGVTVLGTIITEWDEGEKTCAKIFASKSSVDQFVQSLVRLTTYHNFDGWLVNIENKIATELIENIEYFLKRLKKELTLSGNHGHVIWYDSITKDGELKWQNELNDLNRIFFDACDAIFLNYAWSAETLASSMKRASDRVKDVFVGVDVFGRGCFGGGGFNSSKALSVIRDHGLSAALFAPGWVYECHEPSEFHGLNSQFWKSLLPYLYVHGPKSFPIRTSFCPGFGSSTSSFGKVIEDKPWHNMCKQQVQPLLGSLNGLAEPENEEMYKELKNGLDYPFGGQEMHREAFEGGHSLRLFSASSAVFPLFVCHIPSLNTLRVFMALKSTSALEDLNFSIFCKDLTSDTSFQIKFPLSVNKTIESDTATIRELEFKPEISGFFCHELSNQKEWTTRGVQVLLTTTSDTIVQGMSFYSEKAVDCKVGYFSCF